MKTKRRILPAALVALPLAFGIAADVLAQQYPTRPIRIIVPFPAGGNADILARILGQKMTESLGQQIIVDNRAGAAGIIGAQVTLFALRPSGSLTTAGYLFENGST